MFFAGLEVDLVLFKRSRKRALSFGLLTTSCPLILGTVVGLVFGYEPVAAVVLGSLLASHTLLAAPTISRLGLIQTEPITITYGATVMSDTLSLIVFAICLSIYKSGFSVGPLGLQLLEIIVVLPAMVWGLNRAALYLVKRAANQENLQFIILFCIVAVAALIVQSINLPDIVGAFLAGLAINSATKSTSAKEKLEFFGNAIFIPAFFVVTGFIIDPTLFLQAVTTKLPLALCVIGALLLGKWIAAQIVGRTNGYSHTARMTVWSLTLPQVAATLAATLVAYKTLNSAGRPLIDEQLLNVVFVLMLSTAILGPVLTDRFAPRFSKEVHPMKDIQNIQDFKQAS
jgi:Kef-type K+ transport system membrane component KefB